MSRRGRGFMADSIRDLIRILMLLNTLTSCWTYRKNSSWIHRITSVFLFL